NTARGFDLAALAAVVVGVEYEALGIHALEQDDARGRLAIRVNRGDRHGVGLADATLDGGIEPQAELVHRVVREIALDQFLQMVVLAQIAQRLARSRHQSPALLPSTVKPILTLTCQ